MYMYHPLKVIKVMGVTDSLPFLIVVEMLVDILGRRLASYLAGFGDCNTSSHLYTDTKCHGEYSNSVHALYE